MQNAMCGTVEIEMVSLREAARMIRACVRTVYRLIDDGDLPSPIKIRSRSFLPLKAVIVYLVKQGLPQPEGVIS
jgi:predicted DNA-binding transcriptional regulator AlpA